MRVSRYGFRKGARTKKSGEARGQPANGGQGQANDELEREPKRDAYGFACIIVRLGLG